MKLSKLSVRATSLVIWTVIVSLSFPVQIFAQIAQEAPVQAAPPDSLAPSENVVTAPTIEVQPSEQDNITEVIKGDPPENHSEPKHEETPPPPGSPGVGNTTSGSSQSNPQSSGDPPYSTVQPESAIKQIKPEVDLSTGAFTYRYPITLPSGRNGFTPELSFVYNSQDREDGSLVGYGWDLSIPYIIRDNKYGWDSMYVSQYESFTSSLDGQLVSTSGNNFAPKIDDGAFNSYQHILGGLDDYWELKTKSGLKYTFGYSNSARIGAGTFASLAYFWILETIEDANGNKIEYFYTKDQNQIYSTSISYMSPDPTLGLAGIFSVNFSWATRPDVHTSFASTFNITTDKRLQAIEVKINGLTTRKYDPSYIQSQTNNRSLLATVIETGYDESGAATVFPAVSFSYSPYSVSFSSNISGGGPPTDPDIINLDFSDGVVAFDVNGDGYVDVVQARHTDNPLDDQRKVWLNNGDSTFTYSPNWQLPIDPVNGQPIFICTKSIPSDPCDAKGAVLFDIQSDAKSAFVYAPGSGGSYGSNVHLNTGAGWQHAPAWNNNVQGFEPNFNYRPYVADVTGDGLADQLLVSNLGGATSYKNTGYAMVYGPIVSNLPDHYGFRFLDVNNDGLADGYKAYEPSPNVWDTRVFINQPASGLIQDGSWNLPSGASSNMLERSGFGSTRAFLADVNNDGLPDFISDSGIVYLLGYKTWLSTSQQLGPDISGASIVRQVGDVDGDGLLDAFYNVCNPTCVTEIYYNKSITPDILSQITLPTGGTIAAAYKASSAYKNQSGALLNPSLPLTVQTVSSITETDPVSGNSFTTNYEYANGHYYFADPFNRKFAGFEQVTETRSDGSKKISYFHQGNSSNAALYEYADQESKIGKPFRLDVLNSAGGLMSRATTKWDAVLLPSANSTRHFVYQSQQITEDYDGNSGHRDKALTFIYDTNTGDLLESKNWGEVSASDPLNFTDIGTDLFTADYVYAVSSTAALRLPAQETKRDSGSVIFAESKFYYDNLPLGQIGQGNLTKNEWLIDSANNYASTTRVYNSFGLLLEERDPGGGPTTYAYDPFNLYPATVTNILNHQTQYLYDYSLGKPKRITDPNGVAREVVYDGLDRVKEERLPDPASGVLATAKQYSYNDSPNNFSVTENFYSPSFNRHDIRHFDGFGRLIQARSLAEDPSGNVYAVKDLAYDFLGRAAKESLPYFGNGGGRTAPTQDQNLYNVYTYDSLDRLTNSSNALGSTLIIYDDWREFIVDPIGNQKKFGYDAFGRLLKVTEFLFEPSIGATTSLITTYTYDTPGNLTKITDAAGNVRNFTYDKRGLRLTAEDLHAPTDTTFGIYAFTYDIAGNLTQKQTPKGDTIKYTYDALNRLRVENFLGAPGPEAVYIYDSCTLGKGKLCSYFNSVLSAGNAYDYAGNLNIETKTINSVPFTTSYAYDALGNLVSITNPNSSQVNYAYNTAGLVENVNPGISNFDYAPTGEAVLQINTNGTQVQNIYDASKLYRLVERRVTKGSDIQQKFVYSYDAAGNVTRVVSHSNVLPGTNKISDYTYDTLYRLLSASDTASSTNKSYSESFIYDYIGNIVSSTLGGVYLYNGNQGTSLANPHAATSIGSLNLSYNPNGDLTDRSDGVSHEWDYNNRLSKITIPAISPNPGKILTYTYDPSGIRLTSTTKDLNTLQTSTTTYPSIYYNTDGSKVIEHVFANNVPILTLETTGATTQSFWNFQDHLNSTVLVSDSNGGLFERVEYYAFGSILRNPGPHKEQRKYTGHEYDAQAPTNYSYAKARYLDTKFGRFLSQDPNSRDNPEELLKDPQQLNTYSYARNNPLIFIDKDGKKVELAAKYLEQSSAGIHTFIRITADPSNNNSLQHLGVNSDKITLGAYPLGGPKSFIGSLYKGMNVGTDFNVDPNKFVGSITINKPDQYATQEEFEQAILKGYISLPSNLGAYSWISKEQVISNNLPSDLLLKTGVSKGEINSIKNTFPSLFGLKPLAPGVGIGFPNQKVSSLLDKLNTLQSTLQSLLDKLKSNN